MDTASHAMHCRQASAMRVLEALPYATDEFSSACWCWVFLLWHDYCPSLKNIMEPL